MTGLAGETDPQILRIVSELLRLTAEECVFADDTEENLQAAVDLGFSPLFSRDPAAVVQRVRMAFGL